MELWKSFSNWTELCVAKTVDPSTTDFRLYVTPVKTGKLVALLHEADLDVAISGALIKVRKLIKTGASDAGCDPYVNKFLGAGNQVCGSIIKRFQLVTEADPIVLGPLSKECRRSDAGSAAQSVQSLPPCPTLLQGGPR